MKQFFTLLVFALVLMNVGAQSVASSTVPIRGDESQITPAPIFTCENYQDALYLYCVVSIMNDESVPDAVIEFCFSIEGSEYSEWMPYTGDPLVFTEYGYYIVRARAKVDGMMWSDVVEYCFSITESTGYDPHEPQITPAPTISCENYQDGQQSYCVVSIANDASVPDARIEFCYMANDYQFSEWMECTGDPLVFTECGYYCVQARAKADGMEWSDIVDFLFAISDPTGYDPTYYTDYDFIEDGIYYSILNDTDVSVRGRYYCYDEENSENPYPSYSGYLTVPSIVTHDGKTYTVTEIGRRAFWSCQLTSLQLPNTIKTIRSEAFRRCPLTQIPLPESLVTIDDEAFTECPNLTSITIPNSVTTIDEKAFIDCYKLVSVDIGASVTSITYAAFEGCSQLTQMTCRATVPPVANSNMFLSTPEYAQVTLYVPELSIDAYRADATWRKFSTILPIAVEPGDINGDGTLDVDDVTGLLGMLLNGEPMPSYADLNGDEAVDIDDVTLLISKLLGY
jgi:hypothetical protein